MSELKCPPRRSVWKRELPNEEGQFLAYNRKRSGYVSKLTKAINKIKECLNKNELSKIDSYNNCLDHIVDKICRVLPKLTELN